MREEIRKPLHESVETLHMLIKQATLAELTVIKTVLKGSVDGIDHYIRAAEIEATLATRKSGVPRELASGVD